MARNIKGKVEARVSEREGTKPDDKVQNDDTAAQTQKSGDRVNDSQKRKNKEVFDDDDKVQAHHDRLCAIEKRLGITHGSDNMKSEDQKKMGPGKDIAGHVTEKKTANYGRKRHS